MQFAVVGKTKFCWKHEFTWLFFLCLLLSVFIYNLYGVLASFDSLISETRYLHFRNTPSVVCFEIYVYQSCHCCGDEYSKDNYRYASSPLLLFIPCPCNLLMSLNPCIFRLTPQYALIVRNLRHWFTVIL